MPALALNGLSLHHEIDGPAQPDGLPLLLVAGLASDGASWAPLVPLLAARRRVIRPDNRLAGRTLPLDAPASVELCAEDCACLLDALGCGQVHVVGHSMGGLIGLSLAAARPDRVASLSLLASAPMRLARTAQVLDTLVALRRSNADPMLWLRAFYPWLFAPRFFETPGAVEAALAAALAYPHAQGPEAMARQAAMLAAFDPAPRAAQVQAAVLAVLGGHDLLVPPGPARSALATIPRATVVELPEAGHALHWDAPAAVADAVLGFVALHDGPG